jgi:Glycosyl transferases group 1
MPRVLFVGDDWYGSNATSLRDALVRQGCEVLTVDTFGGGGGGRTLARRVRRAVAPGRGAGDARALSASVVRHAKDWRPELLVAFKALLLDAEALAGLSCPKIHYHPDDSTNPENRSPTFESAEAFYDLHITTKSFNVAEIASRAKGDVHFMFCAYDAVWHRCAVDAMPREPAYDVAFIGTRRDDRVELIARLARQFGKRMLIAGSGWAADRILRRRSVVTQPLYGLDFSRAVWSARVHLGLLNSANRDLHSCRTLEVPAAGGLLLAERTSEHEALFEDGESAVLFGSPDELEGRLSVLLEHPARAQSIASNGHGTIVRGRNSYDDRARELLALSMRL